MKKILLLGAGKIGSLISCLLSESGDYEVNLADHQDAVIRSLEGDPTQSNVNLISLNAADPAMLSGFLKTRPVDAVISSLPYYCNPKVAEVALEHNLHYFDLTEDVEVTRSIRQLSSQAATAFVPQCGLAPGFISIVANDLMGRFDELDRVKLRVGALPVNPSNALKYSLTWSTDGLINEYGNLCYGIENGEEAILQPLEGYETIVVDGLQYEAFNTSGGIGTLVDTYRERVRSMNYKTLRYPGHCEKIRFLMQDMKLERERENLKGILENAVPKTRQDVVLVYVSVSGLQGRELFVENYVKKIYPQTIAGRVWSAIQVTTAGSLCAVVDLVLHGGVGFRGFVTQETIQMSDFLENRFGQHYR